MPWLVHMLAQVSGLVAGELVHVIADCHIYDRHVRARRADAGAGGRIPRRNSGSILRSRDFYAFTPDSVQVENYRYHPFSARIPVAI